MGSAYSPWREKYPIHTDEDRRMAKSYATGVLQHSPEFHDCTRERFVEHWHSEEMQRIAGEVWDATRSPQPQQVSYRVQRLIVGSMERLARRGLLQQYLEGELNRDAVNEILDTCREVGDPENSRRNPEVGEAFHRICNLLGLNTNSGKQV